MPVHLYGQMAPLEDARARSVPLWSRTPPRRTARAATAAPRARSAGSRRRASTRRRTSAARATRGAVLTADGTLAGRVRALRNYGSSGSTSTPRPASTAGSTRCRRWCCAPSSSGSRRGTRCAARLPPSTMSCWPAFPRSAGRATAPGNEHVYHLYVVRVRAARPRASPPSRRRHRGGSPLPAADPSAGGAARARARPGRLPVRRASGGRGALAADVSSTFERSSSGGWWTSSGG